MGQCAVALDAESSRSPFVVLSVDTQVGCAFKKCTGRTPFKTSIIANSIIIYGTMCRHPSPGNKQARNSNAVASYYHVGRDILLSFICMHNFQIVSFVVIDYLQFSISFSVVRQLGPISSWRLSFLLRLSFGTGQPVVPSWAKRHTTPNCTSFAVTEPLAFPFTIQLTCRSLPYSLNYCL